MKSAVKPVVIPAPSKPPVSLTSVILTGLNKHFKDEGTFHTLEQAMNGSVDPVCGWLKTGIWGLDYVCGKFRGVPFGKAMAVWGPTGGGKSALAQYLASVVISRLNGTCLYEDFDEAIDTEILSRYKMDLSRVIMPDLDTLEDGLEAMKQAANVAYPRRTTDGKKRIPFKYDKKTHTPLLIVMDSLAAASPRALFEDAAGDNHVAATAKVMHEQAKPLRKYIAQRPILLLFISEARANFDKGFSPYAPRHKMANESQLDHLVTTRLKMSFAGQDKHEVKGREVVRGFITEVRAEKARLGRRGERVKVYVSQSDVPGEGGPRPDKSNLLFLKDNNYLTAGGATGTGIKDVAIVGKFKAAEFGQVVREHGPVILKMLKDTMLRSPLPDVPDDI